MGPLDIVVCVKNVPFTQDVDLVPDASGRDVRKDNLVYVVNEWDNYAVEEAVRLKEELGGTVTAITVGGEDDEEVLRRCLAMGVDEAVRVDPGDLTLDGSVTAALLAAAVKPLPRGLVLTGVQSDDLNQGIVGGLLAEHLALPHASVVDSLEVEDGSVKLSIELEGGQEELCRVPLPALLTIQTGINEPRYVSIMGIRKAAKKEITVIEASSLGLAPGEFEPALTVEEIYMPPEGEAATMLQGDAAAMADQIVLIMREKGVCNG
jgi:electron transfer flavoprotein beta subunit